MNELRAPVDVQYLQSSHFTLSQEESWTPWTRLSTFKKDYIPYNVEDKPGGSKKAKAAEIFNGDERYFKNSHSASETVAEYQLKPIADRGTYDTNKLRKTNFKMDSDNRYQDTYTSVQKSSYSPKSGHFMKAQSTLNTTTSNIPQGDKEKADLPMSDYRDRFRGEIGERRPPVELNIGPSTIRGDGRLHAYQSTHNDNYTPKWQIPEKSLGPNVATNIVHGDPDKEWNHHTEFREAFKQHENQGGYNRNKVSNMQRTQFRLDDGHNAYNDYGTVMKLSYIPKESTLERTEMGPKRNRSDIPEGDNDKWRQAERGGTTSYKFSMQPPPADFEKTPTIDGASIRTKSQVPFGDPDQLKNFYNTTHKDMFVPQNGNPAICDNSSHGASHLPLDYYKGDFHETTTTRTDYLKPEGARTELDAKALNRIKCTSILPPLGGQRHFSTTHRAHFTPLDLGEANKIDPSKLQRSSVPLGTLH